MFLLTSGGQNVLQNQALDSKQEKNCLSTVVLQGVSKRTIAYQETQGALFYYPSPLPYNNLFNVKSYFYLWQLIVVILKGNSRAGV